MRFLHVKHHVFSIERMPSKKTPKQRVSRGSPCADTVIAESATVETVGVLALPVARA
jgi:hypothetical protein